MFSTYLLITPVIRCEAILQNRELVACWEIFFFSSVTVRRNTFSGHSDTKIKFLILQLFKICPFLCKTFSDFSLRFLFPYFLIREVAENGEFCGKLFENQSEFIYRGDKRHVHVFKKDIKNFIIDR